MTFFKKSNIIITEKAKGKTKMIKRYYCNLGTGELTENHAQAVLWFREGDDVEILERRQNSLVSRCSWIH